VSSVPGKYGLNALNIFGITSVLELLASFSMHFSLSLFFFQTFALPFPTHLVLFFPATRASFHDLDWKSWFINLLASIFCD